MVGLYSRVVLQFFFVAILRHVLLNNSSVAVTVVLLVLLGLLLVLRFLHDLPDFRFWFWVAIYSDRNISDVAKFWVCLFL